MNERIKELSNMANDLADEVYDRLIDSGIGDLSWWGIFEGKFAELIIKECANICETEGEKKSSVNLCEEAIQSRKLSCMLKNHFGVI